MAEMSKWERLQASIDHQPTDRIPWSLWRHFYDRESSASDLASAMLAWQSRNDFDFMKVNPRAQYHAEVWGARYTYSGQPAVKPKPVSLPVHAVGDWSHIEVMPPTVPAFTEQLVALSQIRRGLAGTVPFVQTVFTPVSVAGYLIGDTAAMHRHMHEAPDAVHQALRAITETFVQYVYELLNAGVSGIFLATTSWATSDTLSEQEYSVFGRPYDLQVLAAASEASFNILHVCKGHAFVRQLLDYQVQVVHWAASEEGNPSLGEIAETVQNRAVAGGISPAALTALDPAVALREAHDAADQARNNGLVLAGNCSIPVTSSQTVIDALHHWLLSR